MSLAVKPNPAKLTLLAAGTAGFALRSVLYATGTDEKGLLVAGHWAGICLWLLTAAAAGMLFLVCRNLRSPAKYPDAFPASVSGAAGCILMSGALALCRIPEAPTGTIAAAELVLRLLSVASLVCIGFCRFAGRKPLFLFHCVVCMYVALRMVCQYRIWSADPQLINYCFYLGAHVALMLTAYQLAAFDAGFGSHQKLWAAALAAIYLCAVSLAGSDEPFFLLSCGIWCLTNLSHPITQEESL